MRSCRSTTQLPPPSTSSCYASPFSALSYIPLNDYTNVSNHNQVITFLILRPWKKVPRINPPLSLELSLFPIQLTSYIPLQFPNQYVRKNAASDKHVTTLYSEKRFGLVDICLKGNITAVSFQSRRPDSIPAHGMWDSWSEKVLFGRVFYECFAPPPPISIQLNIRY